jgi:hypothetical protein
VLEDSRPERPERFKIDFAGCGDRPPQKRVKTPVVSGEETVQRAVHGRIFP